MNRIFLPNQTLSPNAARLLVVGQALAFLAIWATSSFAVLPRPNEVLTALNHLWMEQGLGQDLITSFRLNLQALAISTVLCLGLAYLTVIPFFRPLVSALAKGRFLSLTGFSLLFIVVLGGGQPLKVGLLVFGISVFFITSMAAVVESIPKADFDYARTLRMSEWRVVWEVVVLGTADKAFEALRQNAAIGWMMLTMVEGIVRSGGGIGTALLNENKQFRLPEVFAIQLVILIVGLIQDQGLVILRRIACPYAELTLERK
jgi:NitT/TauT family transport system permease protein